MTPPAFTGPRYNQFIQSQKVRVIDENGENLGVMYTREAFEQAQMKDNFFAEVARHLFLKATQQAGVSLRH